MIKIDGVAKRNLQEQVGYNSEQIDKIFELLDGLNVQDNLIKLTASSGTLTAEEMDVVSKDVAFIIYNNNLYIKTTTSATEYTFKQVALSASDQGTYNILQSFRIVITRANGAYLYSSNTVLSLYNKAEMDYLLSGKADNGDSYTKAEADALLAQKASLTGASFTGPVTATTFKQSQYNYSRSFNLTSTSSITVDNIYNRFVEINNVLHIIVNMTLTNNSGSSVTLGSGYAYLGFASLSLDTSIASKIVDIEGKTVADPTATLDVLIASEPAQVLLAKVLDSTTKFRSARISLVNRSTENTCAVYVALNGEAGDRLTMADGDTIYVTARMALTLI